MNETEASLSQRMSADIAWHKASGREWQRASRRLNRTAWPAVAFMWLALIGSTAGVTPRWLWVASVALLVAITAFTGVWLLRKELGDRRHRRSPEHVTDEELDRLMDAFRREFFADGGPS